MSALFPLYDKTSGVMNVAGLMSGNGSNLVKLIEGQEDYVVKFIFTDNPASNAIKIGSEFGIPVIVNDIEAFYRLRKRPIEDIGLRREYDLITTRYLLEEGIDLVAFAGYGRLATSVLVNTILSVNVHPADLRILDEHGKRKFTGVGRKAVKNALRSGQKELRASTHILTPELDEGPLLMISDAVEVRYDIPSDESGLGSIAADYQDLLKRKGDHVIFPQTLKYLAQGRYSKDNQGNIYFDGEKIPHGISPRAERLAA